MRAAFICLLVLPLLAGGALAQGRAPEFPPLTGRVVDAADILSPQTENALTLRLRDYERLSSDQIVVATVPDLGGLEIEDYGYRLGREWGIGIAEGEEGRALDNGAILLIAPNAREVRIEVGYGLEPQLTDAMSSAIIRQDILPAFGQGDFDGGAIAGVAGMIAVLSGDEAAIADRLDRAGTRAGGRAVAQGEGGFPWPVVILGAFFLLNGFGGGRRRRRGVFGSRRRGYGAASALPWIIASGAGSRGGVSSGGFSSGGFGGGGFGGGGFSGGGGGFGGGGASGSW